MSHAELKHYNLPNSYGADLKIKAILLAVVSRGDGGRTSEIGALFVIKGGKYDYAWRIIDYTSTGSAKHRCGRCKDIASVVGIFGWTPFAKELYRDADIFFDARKSL